ncbi:MULTISPECIES: sarcosine oxidase subunit gamma family protein [unclassified Mesorhizobium]|uniref:sarcosine oxidase subunit gamma n=1 Tax=unclassified Mesorhizobium TaxID=325217 RepID=UPI000FCA6837|nr:MULTISPECIES: sarcosine oxidase subunit gamma family protein [unclassified Mesorhizobium]RUX97393.1 sarcosine oxidase subunit gamma [Mesorhizobium sp. M7D.F.Ca.US.004.01.2.1]RVA31056.1 sarcosine oxidase subunit gamma [Mesorhizobium sp. M7D.F.Ca.US.004.03.1.1]
MVEFSWASRSPLEKALVTGAHGARGIEAGVSLTEIRNFDLIQVMARRGKAADMAKAAKVRFGVAAPDAPKAMTPDATLIWSGPDQFFVLSKGDKHAMQTLAPALSGSASLSDQSHARALISISGTKARALLAKLSSIDLHPTTFRVGTAAATSMDHTSVTLWRGNDRDGLAVFNLLVFATFAESLWHTMLDSAAEFGVDISHSENLA